MAVVAVGLAGLSVAQSTPAAAATPSHPGPTLIVPAYQYPLSAPDTLQGIWADLAANPPPSGKGYVIANPSSGPGSGSFFSSPDYANYLYAIGRVQAAGWTVLGYTPTGYGTRTLSSVESGVELWESKYGASQVRSGELTAPVTGIFFDTACAGPEVDRVDRRRLRQQAFGLRRFTGDVLHRPDQHTCTHNLGGLAVVNRRCAAA